MAILDRYYSAFAQRDHDGMGRCYHAEARFSDPVFPDLDVDEVRAMWKMLLTRGVDLRITYTVLAEDDARGQAEWDAFYTFARTGRKVHNHVSSEFFFMDGLILRQKDTFDLWRWSRQALGPVGTLLGWTPILRNRLRRSAAGSLRKAIAGSRGQ